MRWIGMGLGCWLTLCGLAVSGDALAPGGFPPPMAGAASRGGTADDGFWRSDALQVPGYPSVRNLLDNPSFEAGALHYTFPCGIGTYIPGYEDKYAIDREVARFGRSSLRIKALKPKYAHDIWQSFGHRVKKDTPYTLSFYAKANRPGLALRVGHLPANSSAPDQRPEAGLSRLEPTDDWQRYVITLRSRSTGYGFSFKVDTDAPGGLVWIDGIQLEEGDAATEYAEKPFTPWLDLGAPGNFLTPADPLDGRLRVHSGRPGVRVRLDARVTDFFYRETPLGTFDFATDGEGLGSVALPLAEHFRGRRGVFVLRCDLSAEGLPPQTAFLRFSVMDKLDGTEPNRTLLGYHQLVIPPYEKGLARWRDIGLGSTNYFYYNFHNRLLFTLLEKYGIEDTGMPLRQHWDITLPSGEKLARNDAITLQPEGPLDNGPGVRVLAKGWRSWTHVTDEQVRAMEEAAREMALYYSWRRNFALDHEMTNRLLELGNYEDMARILIACAKGVKKANPANQAYLDGGAANLTTGIAQTDALLAAAAKVDPDFRFDRFAVHAYGHPEHEEFDELISRYLAVMERHGYGDAPLYLNEGGYYSPFHLPEWGLIPYRPLLMDHYQLWGVSYDMGWGERISAALSARAWLLALKHRDRVKQFNLWRPFNYLDADLTPMAAQKASNTLMRLLGDAAFKSEIAFSAKSRAYVFETADGIPVAAVWGFDEDVEQGKREAPTVTFPDNGAFASVWDFMENRLDPQPTPQGLRLALTPFPLFIQGKKGGLDALTEAIRQASTSPERWPPVHVAARLDAPDRVRFDLRNRLTRPLSVAAEFGAGPGGRQTLDLAGYERRTFTLPLAEATVADALRKNRWAWNLAVEGKRHSGQVDLTSFAIDPKAGPAPLGDAAAWEGIPWLPIGQHYGASRPDKRFAGRFKAQWDAEGLYLLVDVTDPHLFYGATTRNTAQCTDCDTLIVYLDTLADGKDKTSLRVDGDDYYYVFMPRPEEGKALVYTQEACNQQLGLGVDAVKAKTYVGEVKALFRRTPDGYQYEIAFPPMSVMPIRLAEGSVFGFNLMLWDKDDPQGPAQRLVVDGSGWRSAHLWPQAILRSQK